MWNAWDVMRGTANAPVNPKWAYALSTVRTMLGAAQLGRARSARSPISTISASPRR
ncbi:MAG: hypothetical protein WDM81_13595 [Rhizomicrobium sp.]